MLAIVEINPSLIYSNNTDNSSYIQDMAMEWLIDYLINSMNIMKINTFLEMKMMTMKNLKLLKSPLVNLKFH